MNVDDYRATEERRLRNGAKEYPSSDAAWGVRTGAVEVRRQVDETSVWDALQLVRAIDARRYATPAGRDIREAREGALAALARLADALMSRSWDLFEADRRARGER